MRRISNAPPRHTILRRLRQYRVGVVGCGLVLSLAFAWQALVSPYRLPVSLQLLVPCFLLLAVGVHLALSRRRWFELDDTGLQFMGKFGRVHRVSWDRIRDIRYFLGGGLPLSVRVAGQRAPLTLGIPHADLATWTTHALVRMRLSVESGGPLFAMRFPMLFSACALTTTLALVASPLAISRSITGDSDLSYGLFALAGCALALMGVLHTSIRWDAYGVRVGRGRRAQLVPWKHVQAEWRPTATGGTALYIRDNRSRRYRVLLTGWGAPRFVARVGLGLTDPATPARSVRTGVTFPIVLMVFALIGGALLQTSALLISEMGIGDVGAILGERGHAVVTEIAHSSSGVEVRYSFRAKDRQYGGHGWLLVDAGAHVAVGSRVPIRYRQAYPYDNVLQHDPRFFDAVYYAVLGIFHLLFIIPLLALWDIEPAPEPWHVPVFA